MFLDLGVRDYLESLNFQAKIVEKRKHHEIPDCLLFVEYDHTITLGRSGKQAHLLASSKDLKEKNIRFYATDRGGDITYHGPGQLIAYPILDLKRLRRDINWYLRTLEACIIATLKDCGIASRRILGATGVWVEDEKIAAIGVRTSQWVTSHGIALNVNTDLSYFDYIIACGIKGKGVTSIAKVLASDSIDLCRIRASFCHYFEVLFERSLRNDHKEGAPISWI